MCMICITMASSSRCIGVYAVVCIVEAVYVVVYVVEAVVYVVVYIGEDDIEEDLVAGAYTSRTPMLILYISRRTRI